MWLVLLSFFGVFGLFLFWLFSVFWGFWFWFFSHILCSVLGLFLTLLLTCVCVWFVVFGILGFFRLAFWWVALSEFWVDFFSVLFGLFCWNPCYHVQQNVKQSSMLRFFFFCVSLVSSFPWYLGLGSSFVD